MFTNYTDFIRYLAAKKTIDDRSLNTHVFHTFTKNINELYSDVAIHILEAGCGIGSMIERMFTGGILSKAFYTAIDLDPEYIAEAARRLVRRGFKEEMQSQKGWETILSMHGSSNETRVILQTGDVMKFTRNNDVYHLILAHAFLDLVDIYSFLPQILSHVSPGGLAYFTLNFDGVTSLEPTIEADLDRHIIAAYHETMDHRLIYGKSSGDSQTGRHLLPLLHKIGLNILDAGASDWIIFPQNSSYLDDDAYFLHFVVDTIYHALEFCPTLNPEQLRSWTDTRHRQVDKGELFYIAHQLDVLCQIPLTFHDNTLMIALKIKAIIYDCDGVLVDSRESNKAYYNHILEHFGQPPLAEKHLYAIQSLTASEVMAHIFAGTNLLTDALAFEKSLDNERFIPLIEIEPNTRKALTHIRQKYLTAIATNRGKSMHPLLVYHGFETFFNMVVTSYDVKHPKPDPECLNIILKNFYLLPSEVFYIGDNVIDQEMCERIQVPFIAYKIPL